MLCSDFSYNESNSFEINFRKRKLKIFKKKNKKIKKKTFSGL